MGKDKGKDKDKDKGCYHPHTLADRSPQSRERYGHTATYSSNRFTKVIPLIK
jgi:hypothetical protein